MDDDDSAKHFLIHMLKWFGIYAVITYVMFFFLPFPINIIAAIGVFILINFLRARSVMKKYGGISRIKDMFKSTSSPMSGNNQHRPVKYYCMGCGKEHNKIACPNCGSKMKRVG